MVEAGGACVVEDVAVMVGFSVTGGASVVVLCIDVCGCVGVVVVCVDVEDVLVVVSGRFVVCCGVLVVVVVVCIHNREVVVRACFESSPDVVG